MSAQLQLQFPVYGSAFQDDHHFIVAGGGGQGNNGIPNKVSRVKIGGAKGHPTLSIINELEFKGDSATGLVVNEKGDIVVGINDIEDNIKIGENKHLRKFKLTGDEENISFNLSVDLENSKDPLIYQKAISSSSDSSVIAVLSSRKKPSFVRVVDQDLRLIKSIEVEEKEVKDVAVSPNGKLVAYITDREVHVLNIETDEQIKYHNSPRNYSYSKIEFSSDSAFYIAVSLNSMKSSLLLQLVVDSEEAFELRFGKAKIISNKISKITSLDVFNDDLIAVAGNDNSIMILSADDFYVLKTLKNVHKFAITNVEFSPSGKYLLSSSAASTVNIYEVPSGIRNRMTWLYYSFVALILSMIYYFLKANITPDQWYQIHLWIHYLFDEPMEMDEQGNISFVPYNEASPEVSSLPETTIPTEQISTISASDIVIERAVEPTLSSIESETAETEVSLVESTATETVIEVVKQVFIEHGDIVSEVTSSIANTELVSVSEEAPESTAESISPEEEEEVETGKETGQEEIETETETETEAETVKVVQHVEEIEAEPVSEVAEATQ
ncbi:hypothetical protein WICPIJ_000331 [Wickerhamomyces pijperi]|uniref:Guanine nucleotide-exchange factor SEC12 n=1 Tax=Wickerhamomyces pijperi TaxID=599730 RepID=A0A9P8TS62_WICPI|nr:hypothetical protein WICPIJ_000331 [Wickerhamomyces pijperi]